MRQALTPLLPLSPHCCHPQVDRRALTAAFTAMGSRNSANQEALITRLALLARQDAPKPPDATSAAGAGPGAGRGGDPLAATMPARAGEGGAGAAPIPSGLGRPASMPGRPRASRPVTREDLLDSLPLVDEKVPAAFGRVASHFLYPFKVKMCSSFCVHSFSAPPLFRVFVSLGEVGSFF